MQFIQFNFVAIPSNYDLSRSLRIIFAINDVVAIVAILIL